MLDVMLRDVEPDDLPTFFVQQCDPAAHHMAAFTSHAPSDGRAFDDHWRRVLATPGIVLRTTQVDGEVAGYVGSFDTRGMREVTYWLGRSFWGRGIATAALQEFLRIERTRPLYAGCAADNAASLRVLEKCAFVICGEEEGHAYARGESIREYLLRLSE